MFDKPTKRPFFKIFFYGKTCCDFVQGKKQKRKKKLKDF